MKDGTKVLRYLLYLSLIGIGIVLGMAINAFGKVSEFETVNIIDMATLVATIFLAVYIPEVLDRKFQIKKDKKGLIEERIEELQALYRKINLMVQGAERPLKVKDGLSIRNTLDICEHKLETIITLINASKLDLSFQTEILEIQNLCKEHKNLIWITIKEYEEFSYSDSVKYQEELLYNKIDEATCLMIFKISEA